MKIENEREKEETFNLFEKRKKEIKEKLKLIKKENYLDSVKIERNSLKINNDKKKKFNSIENLDNLFKTQKKIFSPKNEQEI